MTKTKKLIISAAAIIVLIAIIVVSVNPIIARVNVPRAYNPFEPISVSDTKVSPLLLHGKPDEIIDRRDMTCSYDIIYYNRKVKGKTYNIIYEIFEDGMLKEITYNYAGDDYERDRFFDDSNKYLTKKLPKCYVPSEEGIEDDGYLKKITYSINGEYIDIYATEEDGSISIEFLY